MAITARLARACARAAVACVVLLGSATGALGAQTGAGALALSRSVPHPGRSSGLTGLSCPSRRSCWAVGSYDNRAGATLNQVLHWDGARWSLVPVPSPGGTARNDVSELAGISCASPAGCWAIGGGNNSRGANLNQALRWNGARWSSVLLPSRGRYFAVSCASPTDCWAVGTYSTHNGFTTLSQALHWNGRTWSQVATPQPGGTARDDVNILVAVSCASPRSCWAVGNQALHWNGRKWSPAAAPSPIAGDTLSGVTCTSATSCWAVGYSGAVGPAGGTLNQALHWNGRRWSVVAAPDPGGTDPTAYNTLYSVTCAGSADCWAVGWYGPPAGGKPAMLNQALHWNGRKWSFVPTPDPDMSFLPTNQLTSVRCTSPATCWAVGASLALNQALRWNGTRWSLG